MNNGEFKSTYDSFNALRQRMKEDLTIRYYLQDYVLKDSKGVPLESSVSITLNDPRTFGDACMYVLGEDKPTWEITGVDESVQPKIEETIKGSLYNNDLILSEEGVQPLDSCLNFFDLFRGWIGGLWIVEQDGDNYCPRVIPFDPLWMTFKRGTRGFEWASYRTRMSSDSAGEKYNKSFPRGDVELENLWTPETFQTFHATTEGLGDELFANKKTVTHNLGLVPFVIEPVPTQPMMISSGESYDVDLSRVGESIYAGVRKIIDYMNEWASIMASMNRMQFLAPLVYKGPKKDLEGKIYGYGKVTFLNEPNESLEPLFVKEVSPAMQTLFRELFSRFEIATMTRMGLGGNPPIETSALLGAQLRSDRDKIFGCRRKVKTTFFRKGVNLWRRQINGTCYTTGVDEEYSVKIDKELFKNKFIINVTFASVSPEESITNLQTAAQAANLKVPRIDIFKNYMHTDDPIGMIRRGYVQDAEEMIPALKLFNAKIALDPGNASQEEIDKARSMIIGKFIEQQAQMGEVQPQQNPASQPKTNIPVIESSQRKSKQMAKNTGTTVEAQGLRR